MGEDGLAQRGGHGAVPVTVLRELKLRVDAEATARRRRREVAVREADARAVVRGHL